jgi:hypothetical protein
MASFNYQLQKYPLIFDLEKYLHIKNRSPSTFPSPYLAIPSTFNKLHPHQIIPRAST